VYGGMLIKEQFSIFFVDMLNKIETFSKSSEGILKEIFDFVMAIENVEEKVLGFLESGLRGAGEGTISIINKISNFSSIAILVPFVIYYFLKDEESFVKSFLKIISLKHRDEAKKILRDVDKILSLYISSRLIVAVVIGVLTFIGFLIIGLPNAFVLSIIAMMFSIIPIVGPIISILPALVLAITTGISMIIKVVAVAFLVQQIEGNFITPKILGDTLDIHPLSVFFIVIVAIALFGFIGALICIPLYAIIKVVIKDIYEYKKQQS
jgi:predicted PurR-regulated permease PerM